MLTPTLAPQADLLSPPLEQPHATRRRAPDDASLEELTAGGPILILAPHPDDDVLGCGGLIAACTAAGVPVHIAYLTDGGRSHLGARGWPGARLSAARRAEAINAAQLLGLGRDTLRFLPNRDGALLFDASARRRIRAELSDLVSGNGITRVFATSQRDPHPDHVATALLAKAICKGQPRAKVVSYPIWGQLTPQNLVKRERNKVRRFDVAAQLQIKREALAAHKTQTTNLVGNAFITLHPSERHRAAFLTGIEIFLIE